MLISSAPTAEPGHRLVSVFSRQRNTLFQLSALTEEALVRVLEAASQQQRTLQHQQISVALTSRLDQTASASPFFPSLTAPWPRPVSPPPHNNRYRLHVSFSFPFWRRRRPPSFLFYL